jgi:hypothetical protein
MKRILMWLCVGAAGLAAQTTINGSRTILGTWDASGAAHSLPSKKGTAANIPATCTTGEEYFATDAAAGRNKYYCTASNTWTQQLGASGGSGAITYADIFDGSTGTLADGGTVTWTCGSGSGAVCTASWTVPAGVNALRIVAWSGGQGGAGSSSGDRSGYGGGGGGYYNGMCPVTPGNSYTVTVGLGGTGGANGYGGGQGNGGASGFGSCFVLLGGGQLAANFGGGLAALPGDPAAWVSLGYFVNSLSYCSYGGGNPAGNALRADVGGCGGTQQASAGVAGQNGGYGIFGSGGGGSGGYVSATGGVGGASGVGGTGGKGGGWTSSGGPVACGQGSIPGGGGGSAGATSSGIGNQTGCAGARGEVRLYYTK